MDAFLTYSVMYFLLMGQGVIYAYPHPNQTTVHES